MVLGNTGNPYGKKWYGIPSSHETKINFRETKLLNVKGKTQVSSRETIFMTFNSPINYKLTDKSQKGTTRLGFGNVGSNPGCHQLGQVTWSHWLSVCSFLKGRSHILWSNKVFCPKCTTDLKMITNHCFLNELSGQHSQCWYLKRMKKKMINEY